MRTVVPLGITNFELTEISRKEIISKDFEYYGIFKRRLSPIDKLCPIPNMNIKLYIDRFHYPERRPKIG